MARISLSFALAATLLLPGCLAIGNGGGGEATMADEIRELEDLRDDGRITPYQYQTGVNTILHQPPAPPQFAPQQYAPQ